MFKLVDHDEGLGLPTDKNHLIFKWMEPNTKMFFSAAEQGKAMSCHFATNKPLMLRKAIPEFCDFIFNTFKVKMIFAKIKRENLGKILERMSFKKILKNKNIIVYMKMR